MGDHDSKLETLLGQLPQLDDRDTLRLMDMLRLETCYFPAVVEVARQGRWKNVRSSLKGYVRIASLREAVRLGLAEPQRAPEEIGVIADLVLPKEVLGERAQDDGSVDTHDAALDYFNSKFDTDSEDGEYSDGPNLLSRYQGRISRELLFQVGDEAYLNYWKVLKRAGLQMKYAPVLSLKFQGCSRDAALGMNKGRQWKSDVTAGWRYLDRHRSEIEAAIRCLCGNVAVEAAASAVPVTPKRAPLSAAEVLHQLAQRRAARLWRDSCAYKVGGFLRT